MNDKLKPKRTYRKVTAKTVADFKLAVIAHGSGASAIRAIEPDEQDPARRAWLISTKAKELDAGEYIDYQMQRIGIRAIEEINQRVQSSDERISLKASMFVIDHVRGKALQRSESKHLNLNIEAVLN